MIRAFLLSSMAAAMAMATSAYAEDIGFSFEGERFTQGDVTGNFYDLASNGYSTPDEITFYDQLPTYLEQYGFYSGGDSFSSGEITGSLFLQDGVIQSGELSASNSTGSFFLDVDSIEISVTFDGYTTLYYQSDQPSEGGSPPVFYPSSAPEPGTWALLAGGVLGIGAALRFGKRSVTASVASA